MFIKGPDVADICKRAIVSSKNCDLAVAYWGRGAGEMLGLTQVASPIRIICDLRSGACNPYALIDLLERCPKLSIRTLDKLHAKVYWTPDTLIVGSANASANGLGDEARDAGSFEAALVTRDETDIKIAGAWFQSLWDSADQVDKSELDRAIPFWKLHRGEGRPQFGELLKEAMQTTRFKDRLINIWVHEPSTASPQAHEKFDEIASRTFDKSALDRYAKANEVPFYEIYQGSEWVPQPGEYILDFTITRRTLRVRSEGMWRVRDVNAMVPIGRTGGKLCLVDRVSEAFGAKYSRSSEKILSAALESRIRTNPREVVDEDGTVLWKPLSDLKSFLGADGAAALLTAFTNLKS